MTHIFRHPKHYKEMRAERRKLQAASDKPQAEGSRPGRPSAKHQAPSVKLRSSFVDSTKLQADIKNPE